MTQPSVRSKLVWIVEQITCSEECKLLRVAATHARLKKERKKRKERKRREREKKERKKEIEEKKEK